MRASLSRPARGGVVETRGLRARSCHLPLHALTSLRLRNRLRHPLRPTGPITLPPAGRPFLATLLLLLPLAGPHPSPQPNRLTSASASSVRTQASLAVPAGANLYSRHQRHAQTQGQAKGQAHAMALPAGIYHLTPERRALLNTIRYAEGTWLGGSAEGYRMLYGGGRFAGYGRHPETEVRRRYVSAAAGAYQFLPQTWKATARELALPDFRPSSQDQAALHLVRKRGALQSFDRDGLSTEVLARLAPEWASLPSWHGGSVYGQPVRSAAELQAFYRQELNRQRELRPA